MKSTYVYYSQPLSLYSKGVFDSKPIQSVKLTYKSSLISNKTYYHHTDFSFDQSNSDFGCFKEKIYDNFKNAFKLSPNLRVTVKIGYNNSTEFKNLSNNKLLSRSSDIQKFITSLYNEVSVSSDFYHIDESNISSLIFIIHGERLLPTDISNDLLSSNIKSYVSAHSRFLNINSEISIKSLDDVITVNHLDNDTYIYYMPSTKPSKKNNLFNKLIISRISDHMYKGQFTKYNKLSIEMIYSINPNSLMLDIFSIATKPYESHIKPKRKYNVSAHDFITFDIETYSDINGFQIPYAAGFKSANRHGIYYNTADPVNDALLDIFEHAPDNTIIYAHNFSGFDGRYILSILYQNNYKVEIINNGYDILGVIAHVKINNKKKKFIFKDSYKLMPLSLDSLAKSFGLIGKSHIPYDFINADTLKYIGPKPSIKFFKNISIDDYNNLPDEYSVESQVQEYLFKDVDLLYEVISKFSFNIATLFDYSIKRNYSISGLAFSLFRTNFYKSENLMGKNMPNHLRNAYMGGISNVFKPYSNKQLYYYDVNSLYPYAMLNKLPVGGYTHIISSNISLDDLDGIAKAVVYSPKNNLYPFMAEKTKKSGLTQRNGKFTGYFTTLDLKYAKSLGYDVKVLEGYHFNTNYIFNDYVDVLYKEKNTSTGAIKFINKLLLNSLYGILGFNESKIEFNFYNFNSDKDKSRESELKNLLDNDNMEYRYEEYINGRLYMFDFDSSKIDLSKHNISNLNSNIHDFDLQTDCNFIIAAWITSYARIHMHKLIMQLHNDGHNIFYTDTDSIITDKPVNSELLGDDIGLLKNEYPDNNIIEGYFIAPKIYGLKFADNSTKVVCKGARNITYNQIIDAYNGSPITTRMLKSRKMGYLEGVKFNNVDIKIDGEFNKRKKIFDDNGAWIDTLPFYEE